MALSYDISYDDVMTESYNSVALSYYYDESYTELHCYYIWCRDEVWRNDIGIWWRQFMIEWWLWYDDIMNFNAM